MKHPVSLRHAAALTLIALACLTHCPAAPAQTAAPAQNSLPIIKRLTPSLAPVGFLVQIAGAGFTGATVVTFNRVPARFTVNSDHEITAVVPSGAVTGPVRVIAPGGAAILRAAFTLGRPKATLAGLTPAEGAAGKLVQIIGTGLSGARSVTLHGKPVRFRVVSDTVITITIPVGATSGLISVTTPYGVVTSEPFTVL